MSHLAVLNPKSNSTPVRIVFNSSQSNSCLAKGPDCHINNLIGVLLRRREEAVALVGDIRKMFSGSHSEMDPIFHQVVSARAVAFPALFTTKRCYRSPMAYHSQRRQPPGIRICSVYQMVISRRNILVSIDHGKMPNRSSE